jgi:ATP-dependent helicase/nuclease subunit B
MALWLHPETGFLHRLHAHCAQLGVHFARVVVLLPYAQLRPLAMRLWAQAFPDGFAPRFETTFNWINGLRMQSSATTDIHFDAVFDSLTAHDLLQRAGLAPSEALVALLVQTAHQLGPLASAHPPQARSDWAVSATHNVVLEGSAEAQHLEHMVARIAVQWAAISGYASDVLFEPQVRASVQCLVWVQGLVPDPMEAGLQRVWGDQLHCLPLTVKAPQGAVQSALAMHACTDGEDEAQRVAACVLRHVQAGRFPVALVSSDRVLTRRVRAMLQGAGLPMRDENGWKLSTSAAAARVVALLHACARNVSTDAVLAWLKVAPAWTAQADALELLLRRAQVRAWSDALNVSSVQAQAPLQALCAQVEHLRQGFAGRHGVPHWLSQLRQTLEACGLWASLQADGAGTQVLDILHLGEGELAAFSALAANALWGQRKMDAFEFTAWVKAALEGASFQPLYPENEALVILPMSQMLARPFAALVLAGCDEVRLPASPEPPGHWTAAQRLALGLPSRESLGQAVYAAWWHALQTPLCDVLWRSSDDSGETLLPSPLVLLLQWETAHTHAAPDPRAERSVVSAPVFAPLPTAADLPLRSLTQGAYEDLRNCPYRFFAMRLLRLQSVDELDGEVDKRDWGVWLHAVLTQFHTALQAQGAAVAAGTTGTAATAAEAAATQPALLEASSVQVTQTMALPQGEFLPFAAAWPAVREGYLQWLAQYQTEGSQFVSAETVHQQNLHEFQLNGRIDRMDQSANGQPVVLDYKTEAWSKTAARVKTPLEDTQMAFYAALLNDDRVRAGYVNVGEDETKWIEQPHVLLARDALVAGIVHDLRRVRQGAALPALGEGAVCGYCQARGLCRKDFWTTP